MTEKHVSGTASRRRTTQSTARLAGRALAVTGLPDAFFRRHVESAVRTMNAAMSLLASINVALPPPAREPWQQSHHAQYRKEQAMRSKARRR
jgi:hypothetical protein